MMRFWFVLGLLSLNFAHAQHSSDSLQIDFEFYFRDKPLLIGENYQTATHDTLQIDVVKFYISDVELVSDKVSMKAHKKNHLVEWGNSGSYHLAINKSGNISHFKSISFTVGVDSLSNVSGAMDGDLDAVHAMYWSWQSGFVNFKVEGKSNSCATRKKEFKFHIGGYQNPFNTLKRVEVTGNLSTERVRIKVDLAPFFDQLALRETNSVMIPGAKAMQITKAYPAIFSLIGDE